MDLGAPLKGRYVVVTGASGLGEHFARVRARSGAAVTVAARRREKLKSLVHDLEATGAKDARALELDVTDEASVQQALAGLRDRPIDVLVNNGHRRSRLDTPLAEFDQPRDHCAAFG